MPFKGKTEILCAQINGDIAANLGGELGTSISLGSIETDLSFGAISCLWDDGLATSDTFRFGARAAISSAVRRTSSRCASRATRSITTRTAPHAGRHADEYREPCRVVRAETLIADREGVAFLGGEGDDRFCMGDGVLASATGETVDTVTRGGGAGVDHAFLPLPGAEQSVAFAREGDSLRITRSFVNDNPLFTPDGVGQIDRLLTGFEDLSFTGDATVTFRRDDTDPVITPDRVVDLPEDRWRPFNASIPDRAFSMPRGMASPCSSPACCGPCRACRRC